MGIAEIITISVGLFGALAGTFTAWAGLRNANNGKQNSLTQVATFLQSEVTRLNSTNDAKDKQIDELKKENEQLHNLLERRYPPRR